MRSPRSYRLAHAQEDAAVLFQAEIVGFEGAGDLDEERVVHQDGAQDEPFGVQIGGQSSFQRNISVSGHTRLFYGSDARCAGQAKVSSAL